MTVASRRLGLTGRAAAWTREGMGSALPTLALLGTIWGLTPALAKLLVQSGWTPLTVATCMGTISGSILLGIILARGDSLPLSAPYLRHYLCGGLFGLMAPNFFAMTALQYVPAGFFALVIPLSPLVTVAVVAALGMEPMTQRRLLGTLAGLLGVALAMAPGAALPDFSLLPWALMITLTPICYAASNILGVRLAPRGAPALVLAAGATLTGAAMLWCVSLATGQFRLGPANALMFIPLLQGVIGALAFVVYFRSLARHGGVVTSQIGYLITITGLFWGFLFFGEVPGWLTIPAAALVFTGLALVTLPGRRSTRAGA